MSSKFYFNEGIRLKRQKEFEKSLQSFSKAIELNPQFSKAYNSRGRLFKNHFKDYEEALQDFSKAIELNPQYSGAYNNRGLLLDEHFKEYERALQDYSKAIELNPRYSSAFNNRGHLLRNHFKEYEKALQDYSKAIELNPQYSIAYYNRGRLFMNHFKDYEKALQDFSKAIELDPQFPNTYYHRGYLYMSHFNEYQKAILDFKKVIEIDPELKKMSYFHKTPKHIQGCEDFLNTRKKRKKEKEEEAPKPPFNKFAFLAGQNVSERNSNEEEDEGEIVHSKTHFEEKLEEERKKMMKDMEEKESKLRKEVQERLKSKTRQKLSDMKEKHEREKKELGEEFSKQVSDLKEKLKSLNIQIKELQGSNDEQRNEINSLETNLRSTTEELKGKTEEVARVKSKNVRIEEEKETSQRSYEEKIKNLEEEVKERTKEVETTKEQLEILQKKTRVETLVEDINNEEISKMNPSKGYREDYIVDFETKINDGFYDCGPDPLKKFKPYTKVKDNLPDAFFETIRFDRKSDPEVDKFLKTEIEKKKVKKAAHALLFELKKKDVECIIPFVEALIIKVSNFFGGFPEDQDLFEAEMKKVIESIQFSTEEVSNVVHLGQLKNHGVCRHRSILFKVVCDILNIRCRLVRGKMYVPYRFVDEDDNEQVRMIGHPHCWNVVHLKNDFFIVDCMNFEKVQKKNVFQHYMETSERKRLALSIEKEERYKQHFSRNFSENGGPDQVRIDTGGHSFVWKMTTNLEEEDEGEEEEGERKPSSAFAVKETTLRNIDLKYLEKEYSLLKSMDHPNIVKTFCSFTFPIIGEKPTRFCLVLEYMPNNGKEFLEKFLVWNKKDPTKQAMESLIFLLHTARGLRHLHDNGYMHLDLKPLNVLVEWDESDMTVRKVKLIDFVGSKEKAVGFTSKTLLHGTTWYTAPEVKDYCRKKEEMDPSTEDDKGGCKELVPFDESADIYSFGKMMKKFLPYLKFSHVLVELAESCVKQDPRNRPNILTVINRLMRMLEFLDKHQNE